MVSTGGFIGKQSQSPLSSPIVHQQTPSHGATSPASPGFLFSYTAGQLLDRSVKVETRGHLTKAGVFGKHTIIDNERSNVNKVANHDLIWKKRSMLMHSGVLYPKETTKPSRVVPGTSQYASGLYIGRYPVDDDPQVYQHRNQQVYPRGYTTDYVSPKTYILSDSSKTSNQQKVGTVFSPFKQIKEDTFERVVCDSTNNGLSTSASDTNHPYCCFLWQRCAISRGGGKEAQVVFREHKRDNLNPADGVRLLRVLVNSGHLLREEEENHLFGWDGTSRSSSAFHLQGRG